MASRKMADRKATYKMKAIQGDYLQEEMRIVNEVGLTKMQIDELKEKFKKYDSSKQGQGTVSKHEIYEILKELKYCVNDKVRKKVKDELFKTGVQRAEFIFVAQMAKYALDIEDADEMETENFEYIDAFCAMGGGPGVEGVVTKSKIIQIVKNDFELTFDMEELLEEITEGQEELNFRAFCQLFESNYDDAKSVTSRQSFRTAFSDKFRKTNQSFHVRYADFIKFCEKYDN